MSIKYMLRVQSSTNASRAPTFFFAPRFGLICCSLLPWDQFSRPLMGKKGGEKWKKQHCKQFSLTWICSNSVFLHGKFSPHCRQLRACSGCLLRTWALRFWTSLNLTSQWRQGMWWYSFLTGSRLLVSWFSEQGFRPWIVCGKRRERNENGVIRLFTSGLNRRCKRSDFS